MTSSQHAAAGTRRGAGGFSLIEVLVALIIISVGMLGLAKIQALAYASTGIASQQSLAAFQASSLVSAMRANRKYWSTVSAFSFVATTTAAGATTSDATLKTGTATSCTLGGANAPCSVAQLAAADLYYWVLQLNTVLPNPTASIQCPTPVAGVQLDCTIQLTWLEHTVAVNTNGINAATGAANTLTAPTYTLYVVP